tara:strand:- start:449 stop:778 length:330 start_codon:yes stop_codon:yes gene_type:complete
MLSALSTKERETMLIETERELAALLYGMKIGASCGLQITAIHPNQIHFADIEDRYTGQFSREHGVMDISADSDAPYYPSPVIYAAEGMSAESLREAQQVFASTANNKRG